MTVFFLFGRIHCEFDCALKAHTDSSVWVYLTDEAQLREFKNHPLLWRLLQGEILHRGEVIWPCNNVIL